MFFIKLLKAYFSAFFNSQLQCIFSMYLYWMRKNSHKIVTKEQSLLFPEIDVCLWGNPACNFQNLQIHCKLNHVASTQIIPSFKISLWNSQLPFSLKSFRTDLSPPTPVLGGWSHWGWWSASHLGPSFYHWGTAPLPSPKSSLIWRPFAHLTEEYFK